MLHFNMMFSNQELNNIKQEMFCSFTSDTKVATHM